MNEVMNMGNTILNSELAIEVLIAAIVISILVSFFGLKLIRLLTVIVGLVLGAGIGVIISSFLGWTGLTAAIVTFGGAVIMAVLSFFLYRMGVFFTVFLSVFGVASVIMYPETNLLLIVYLLIALAFAVLSVIFVEPFVIVVTAISGAANASVSIAAVAGLEENLLFVTGIAAAIAIVGLIVQFMMHSRKIGKKEKKQAAIIKEKDSVESEVEKARLILDDVEEDEIEETEE